jgi:hypothetical protein
MTFAAPRSQIPERPDVRRSDHALGGAITALGVAITAIETLGRSPSDVTGSNPSRVWLSG